MKEMSFKEKLRDNIWITRKCRIIASERLLANAKFVEFLNVYYSIFVLVLSIFSILDTENGYNLSVIGLIISIALTVSITYANTIRFRERSETLKINYIEMQRLILRLDALEGDDQTQKNEVSAIGEKYAELQKAAENHLQIDWYKQKRESSGDGNKLTNFQRVSCFVGVAWRFLFKACLVLLPVAIVVVYCCSFCV